MDPLFFQLIFLALSASPDKNLDRVQLAKKIKSGDHEAFQTFFNAHYDALFRFLLSKKLPSEDAKDIIQKAFIYIWNHRQNIDPEQSLRAYIFKIAYTRMINLLRDNKKFGTYESVGQTKQDSHNPQNELQHTEILQLIQSTIENMPDRRRMVFDLCFMQEFTYKEAGEILEISNKTVENHMALALKDVRKALKNHGLGTLS